MEAEYYRTRESLALGQGRATLFGLRAEIG